MNRWIPFESITAVRFLREGLTQTLFIVSGIAIGVGVIVFMSAMLSSLQSNFIDRVLTSQPHIQIGPADERARPLRASTAEAPMRRVVYAPTVQQPAQRLRSVDQWQAVVRLLHARADVSNVTASVSTSALVIRGDASRSIGITGIDPPVYFRIVRIPEYLVLGVSTLTNDQIIIGTDLGTALGVTLGDKINVVAANGMIRTLTISGVFDLGNRGANERSVFVTLRTAQTLGNLPGGVTSIDITVRDLYAAETIAQSIQASTGLEADSWMKTNAQLFSTLSAQEMSFTTIRAFVALSVAFGIASVLSVSVIQRAQDIGILRAMGTTQRQILRVFLLQGALLGMAGAVIGSALGVGALRFFHETVRLTDGSELFPFAIEPGMIVAALAIATATGVLAAAFPALHAARLDPVNAIRN